MAGEVVLGPLPRRRAERHGPGCIGAHIGAALLLGHEHADRGAGLFRPRNVALVVGGREHARDPLVAGAGIGAQHRDHRIGHRHRAHDAAFGLREHVGHRHVRDLGAAAFVGPGKARHAVADRKRHQVVVGGMEGDLVDAHAVAVVGPEFGGMAVGGVCLFEGLGGADFAAEARQRRLCPAAAFARNPRAQHRIVLPQILIAEMRWHVGDRMRLQFRYRCSGCHGGLRATCALVSR